MEIGPITAVRPIPSIKRSPAAPDLSRVFEVEYLGESGDDAYTPGHSNASRGLEDEDDLAEDTPDAEDAPEIETPPEPAAPSIKVNFFA